MLFSGDLGTVLTVRTEPRSYCFLPQVVAAQKGQHQQHNTLADMAENLYATATIGPNPAFNADATCEALHTAMKGAAAFVSRGMCAIGKEENRNLMLAGFGCNKAAVVKALVSISADQRVACIPAYKRKYNKDLLSELKSELSGNLESAVLALMMTPPDYDAWCLHDAMAGLGTNEDTLVEILVSRTDAELAAAKASYEKLYGKSLEKAVASETSGDFQRVLLTLAKGERERGSPPRADKALADQQAKDLHAAGEAKVGTDEAVFQVRRGPPRFFLDAATLYKLTVCGHAQRVLVDNHPVQVRAVLLAYRKISDYGARGSHAMRTAGSHPGGGPTDVTRIVEKEMSGDLKKVYLALIEATRYPIVYYAHRLHKAMAGAGTNDKALVRRTRLASPAIGPGWFLLTREWPARRSASLSRAPRRTSAPCRTPMSTSTRRRSSAWSRTRRVRRLLALGGVCSRFACQPASTKRCWWRCCRASRAHGNGRGWRRRPTRPRSAASAKRPNAASASAGSKPSAWPAWPRRPPSAPPRKPPKRPPPRPPPALPRRPRTRSGGRRARTRATADIQRRCFPPPPRRRRRRGRPRRCAHARKRR